MHSLALLLALALTFVSFTTARVPNNQRDASPNPRQGVINYIKEVFRLQTRQEVCNQDDLYYAVQNNSDSQAFCSRYLSLAPVTVTVDYTPTVTDISTYATSTSTTTQVVRNTPVVTVTESTTAGSSKVRRGANAADVVHFIRQELANSTTSSYGPAFSEQISSACRCLPAVQLSTTTATYTSDPTHTVQLAHVNMVQTINSTAVGRATTTTVTKVVVVPTGAVSSSASSSSSSSSSSSAAPTPISPAFTCPDDNNMTVSQIVDNQRYDFLVSCGYDYNDANLASYSYSTFGECAAACARADNYFKYAICQAAVYYGSVNSGQSNCFLKVSANSTVAMPGVNAAVLLQVAIAVTNTTGATSSSSAFASTSTVVDTSSVLSSVFANSSTSMPLITPAPTISGRMPNAGVTSYATFVSDGSTYSTESVYSTYYSANGSWYESYYTSWTVAWSAETTIVGAAAASTATADSSGGANGANGSGDSGTSYSNTTISQYGSTTITNITTIYQSGGSEFRNQTIVTDTAYPNGETSSTSTTTVTQIGGAGGAGGAQGSNAGGSTSNSTTTTTMGTEYNTTEIYNITSTSNSSSSSGGGGAGGSGGSSSGGPGDTYSSSLIYSTQFSTVYTSTYGSAGGSGFATGGGSGAISTAASGVITSTPASNSPATITSVSSTEIVFSTVIVSSGGTAGGSGFAASGFAGGSGTAASGAITPLTNTSSPSFTNGPRSGSDSDFFTAYSTAYSTGYSTAIYSTVIGSTYVSVGGSGFAASGSVFESGTAISGAATPSVNTSSPAFTGAPRSGTESIFSTAYSTVIVSQGGSGFAASGFVSETGTALSGAITPSANVSSPTTFSGTGLPRAGTESPSTTSTVLELSFSSGIYVTITSGLPSVTPSPSFNTSIPTSLETASASGPIVPSGNSTFSPSFSGKPRTGTDSLVPSGTPLPTGNFAVTPGPTGTAPISLNTTIPTTSDTAYSITDLPRSGTESGVPTPSSNSSVLSVPTAPSTGTYTGGFRSGSVSSSPIPTFNISSGAYSLPPATGFVSIPMFTGTGYSGQLVPTTNSTLPAGPTGTSPRSSGSGLRTGTYETTTTTPTPSTSTCDTAVLGTITMWSTTTEFGCYSSCPPTYFGGGYPAPTQRPGGH